MRKLSTSGFGDARETVDRLWEEYLATGERLWESDDGREAVLRDGDGRIWIVGECLPSEGEPAPTLRERIRRWFAGLSKEAR